MNEVPHRIRNITTSRDGVIALLRTARALAIAGRAIDLTGIDNMIGMLCAQVLDLSEEEGRGFRASLCAIGAELEHLNQILIETA